MKRSNTLVVKTDQYFKLLSVFNALSVKHAIDWVSDRAVFDPVESQWKDSEGIIYTIGNFHPLSMSWKPHERRKPSPKEIAARERRSGFLKLWEDGMSYAEIGRRNGITGNRAADLVKKAKKEATKARLAEEASE